MQQLNI